MADFKSAGDGENVVTRPVGGGHHPMMLRSGGRNISCGASDDSPENAATTENAPIDQLINATACLKSDFSRDSDAAAASDAAKCDS